MESGERHQAPFKSQQTVGGQAIGAVLSQKPRQQEQRGRQQKPGQTRPRCAGLQTANPDNAQQHSRHPARRQDRQGFKPAVEPQPGAHKNGQQRVEQQQGHPGSGHESGGLNGTEYRTLRIGICHPVYHRQHIAAQCGDPQRLVGDMYPQPRAGVFQTGGRYRQQVR